MLNHRYILQLFGLVLIVLSSCLVTLALYSMVEAGRGIAAERPALLALSVSAAASLLLGGTLWGTNRPCSGTLGRREALLLVAMSWLLGALVCAAPYYLWALWAATPDHEFRSIVDCYFESMSGLTTTGASILANVEALPTSLLLWRATTHWLGGLGIVVLFVAVLPLLGASGKRLYRAEAPGPVPEGVRPQIRETARMLWILYLAFTGVQIAALILTGVPVVDAICLTFATLATGGFAPRNASVGAYPSFATELVVIVFMALAAVNFGLYYRMLRGGVVRALRDSEMRTYFGILAAAVVLVTINVVYAARPIVLTDGSSVPPTPIHAARYALFTVTSIQTTTGFATADFDHWPFLSRGILVALMFVGGCAGSTGGGMKVIRVITCFKVILAEIERAFRPNVVRPVKVNHVAIDEDLKRESLVFVLVSGLLLLGGAACLKLLEPASSNCTYATAASASAATLFNVGPGLGLVGAVRNYGWMTDSSKVVLSLLMVLGRLEIFPVLVLFVPRFWRGN